MISRKSTIALAMFYVELFKTSAIPGYNFDNDFFTIIDSGILYDFLYSEDYDAWFCNLIRSVSGKTGTRHLQDFIMKLQTGESLSSSTPDWSWEERIRFGQRYLRDLAEDILVYANTEYSDYERTTFEELEKKLVRYLELDGYILFDSKLLSPEVDVVNVEQELSLLKELYLSLELNNSDTSFHHLDLSEEHYIEEKWDDSISNSRKYLESVLREVANAHCFKEKEKPINEDIYKWAGKVRDYLNDVGLLEKKEKDALSKIYGLLSETGSHPYMAKNDQARLLRHLSLTFSQFVLIRFRGYLKAT